MKSSGNTRKTRYLGLEFNGGMSFMNLSLFFLQTTASRYCGLTSNISPLGSILQFSI
jgi:hypothetical protein